MFKLLAVFLSLPLFAAFPAAAQTAAVSAAPSETALDREADNLNIVRPKNVSNSSAAPPKALTLTSRTQPRVKFPTLSKTPIWPKNAPPDRRGVRRKPPSM